MFKKKPSVKTLSPLRSSERRKIADRIISDYNLSPSTGDQDGADDAAALSALRSLVLPENSLSAKYTTTSGPDLRETVGVVYVGACNSDQRILWFTLGDVLLPSVYSLWRIPALMPLLHTPTVVLKKMLNGADLMTPGLAGPPFPPGATNGKGVAVAAYENPTVPVAVGKCVVDVASLKTTSGAKGVAVETVHVSGDELWTWSTSGKKGSEPPESLEGWVVGEVKNVKDVDEIAEGVGGVSLENVAIPGDGDAQAADEEESLVEIVDVEMTTKDIDEAFRSAFIYGIHQHMRQNPSSPRHGLDFPLSQSVVMSSLVLPFLPTFTQQHTNALVIKKTSWKNIRKFLKALEKDGLLLAKDRGNEVTVLDVDFEERAFREFVPYRLPTKSSDKPAAQTSTTSESDDPSVGQQITRISLYRAPDSLSAIFSPSKNKYHQASDLRKLLDAYATAETLKSTSNPRIITLNPVLYTLLPKDTAPPLPKTAPIDHLTTLLTNACHQHHLLIITPASSTPQPTPSDTADLLSLSTTSKPPPGSPPQVTLTLSALPTGQQKTTRIRGIEAYGISPTMFAAELRKSCASATGIEPIKGAKVSRATGAEGPVEVMVQGLRKDEVLKALARRGVKEGWVNVEDKVKKKK